MGERGQVRPMVVLRGKGEALVVASVVVVVGGRGGDVEDVVSVALAVVAPGAVHVVVLGRVWGVRRAFVGLVVAVVGRGRVGHETGELVAKVHVGIVGGFAEGVVDEVGAHAEHAVGIERVGPVAVGRRR